MASQDDVQAGARGGWNTRWQFRFWPPTLFFSKYHLFPYTIYAAREDEYNAGYVWFLNPEFVSRTPIELYNPDTGYTTYCKSRLIERNYMDRYKSESHRVPIDPPEKALVVSEWYRNALGGFDTTANREWANRMAAAEADKISATTLIGVRRLRVPGWRYLRVANHHPDMAVRVGTRLGVLGAWLGVVGTAGAVMDWRAPITELLPRRVHEWIPGDFHAHSIIFLLAIAALSGVLFWIPCRAPRPPVQSFSAIERLRKTGRSYDDHPTPQRHELEEGQALLVSVRAPTGGSRSGTSD